MCSGSAKDSGGPAAGSSPFGRWSSTTMRRALSVSICSVRASRAAGVHWSSASCTSTRRPSLSHTRRRTLPPLRTLPVTSSDTSGCCAPAQRSAVASEPSLPVHHHRPPSASSSKASKAANSPPSQRQMRRRRTGGVVAVSESNWPSAPAGRALAAIISGVLSSAGRGSGAVIRTRSPRSCAAGCPSTSGRTQCPAASGPPA